MPDCDLELTPFVDVRQTFRVEETMATGKGGVGGQIAAAAAADAQGRTLPRADLLAMVKTVRGERGRKPDTATDQLLSEVAWFLEEEMAAAAPSKARLEQLNVFTFVFLPNKLTQRHLSYNPTHASGVPAPGLRQRVLHLARRQRLAESVDEARPPRPLRETGRSLP